MFFQINQWLSKRMFICVLSGLVAGYFIRIPISALLQNLMIVLFAYMTFITALGTSLKEFVRVLKWPRIPLYILFLVHFVTPLLAFVIGLLCFPDEPLVRIGYLVGAAIPIGVTSIIWVSVAKGNVPVSLVAVTLDAFITPILLPLYFKMVLGTQVSVDYAKMALDLFFMITLPSVVGMLLYDMSSGKTKSFAAGFGGVSSKFALFGVIFLNATAMAPEIKWDGFIIKILLVTFLMITLNYILGYLGSLLIKNADRGTIMAIIYNTGMRNISSGAVLAIAYFPPAAGIPIILGMLYQQPLAALVPWAYNKLHRE
ncbi:MAG: bile acid:sodium symporter [Pelosinus sp.]|nr:bile acid:sodium symporter [Pelosinus sp.]